MAPGAFIQPDPDLETLKDPNEKLRLPIFSGYKALRRDGVNHLGRNRIFDEIFTRLKSYKVAYEDQCSAQYYFDLVQTLRDFSGEYDRVVEVGVYMGGSTTVFAGCAERFDYDLDLVDVHAPFLLYAYERARRLFPDAARRIRLFHGDLPAYVNAVSGENFGSCVVHHDGAHDFNQVVKDMASLSFIRDRLHAVIAQDTNLRGSIEHMNFVDMALYAVFGLDLNYAPIGAVIDPNNDFLTAPNCYQGNYCVPGQHEGFVLPMAMNHFHYPHPNMTIEPLLAKAA